MAVGGGDVSLTISHSHYLKTLLLRGEKDMTKEQLKEFLQNMWCALNCATTNNEQMKIMGLMETYGGSAMPKWRKYVEEKKNIFKESLKEMEKLIKNIE